jgi:hypothetical protein
MALSTSQCWAADRRRLFVSKSPLLIVMMGKTLEFINVLPGCADIGALPVLAGIGSKLVVQLDKPTATESGAPPLAG